MKQTDRAAFAAEFMRLAEVYDREPSEGLAEAYFEALAAFEVDEVRAAARVTLRTSRFFPRPVELIETISQARRERRALATSERLALTMGTVSEPERRSMFERLRAFTASLVGAMRAESPRRTLDELNAETARLRAADQADPGRHDRVLQELERMRKAGLL